MNAVSLRPFLPADTNQCAEIFRAAIQVSANEDYSDDQLDAWAARANDAEAFGAKLGSALTLVALIDGGPVGFASLRNKNELDMVYVDPRFGRRGVGSTLIDALTRLAVARGAELVTSEASDTARPLFERHGFVAQLRNLVQIDDQWLANTTMTKRLASPRGEEPTRH
ncbi:MAG TPA: GNAT family N-acetyltransferase [Roseiarcus sp.]|jgi:putative acetyltransferase